MGRIGRQRHILHLRPVFKRWDQQFSRACHIRHFQKISTTLYSLEFKVMCNTTRNSLIDYETTQYFTQENLKHEGLGDIHLQVRLVRSSKLPSASEFDGTKYVYVKMNINAQESGHTFLCIIIFSNTLE